MFLFKRKKDEPQEKTVLDKTESIIKLAKENRKDGSKKIDGPKPGDTKKQDKSGQFSKNLNTGQTLETDSPMKVVIPASSLNEDEEVVDLSNTELTASEVPEEDVDKLLIEVNKDKPEVDVPDISLDILVTPKDDVDKTKNSQNGFQAKTEAGSEVKKQTEPEIKSEKKPDIKSEDKPVVQAADKDKKDESGIGGNLFSNLFGKVEVEEDDPIKKLIKTLPDITIDEVMVEAEEVNSLISEWYSSQGKNVIK